jgi:hypothetical protein
MTKHIVIAALAVFAFGAPAMAGDLKPMDSQSIDLGAMNGVAYYTVEPDGYHVVATLIETDHGTPVRFEATLTSGQAITLSTPRALGEPPLKVEISRVADQLLVQDSDPINSAEATLPREPAAVTIVLRRSCLEG